MKSLKSGLCFWLCLILACHCDAAPRYWIASVSSNWNNSSNWSASSGGSGGASVPGVADIVNFDNLGLGNCTIDIAVSVNTLNLNAGFTSAIQQGSNAISVSTTANFSGGTFTGGNANITITGAFSLTGTVFNSTTAILELRDNAAFTGGTFANNNGSVRFNSTNTTTQTISGTSPVFFNLEFVGISRGYTISSVGNITVVNNLALTGSNYYNLFTGAIDVKGDITVTNTSTLCGGDAQINIIGLGTQNFSGAAGVGQGSLPKLAINKSSGTLNLFNFPSVENDFIYTAGSINSGTSTFCFTRGNVGTYSITGSLTLTNILFTTNTSGINITINPASTLVATGNLLLDGTGNLNIATGNINVSGNLILTNTAFGTGGTTTINILGSGTQTIDASSLTGGQGRLPNIIINKTGGTLAFLGNISFLGNVTYVAGTIVPGTATIHLTGTLTVSGSFSVYNLSITSSGTTVITLATGTILNVLNDYSMGNGVANNIVINTGTIAVQGNIMNTNTANAGGGSGLILINGTGTQNITSTGVIYQGTFPAVTINKISGTLTLPAMITVKGNWTYISGTIDVSTNNSTVVFGSTLTITGSHTLNNAVFDGFSAFTFTMAVGTTLTLAGNMTISGALNVFLNTGTITLLGNLILSNTATGGGGNAIINISGTLNQAITGILTIYQSSLPAVTINKPSGTLTFPALITVKGNWTYSAGLLDASTNNSNVVFAGNLSITGSHTLNNITFDAANTSTYTIVSGTTLTASGNMTMSGTSNIFLNTGTINLNGNLILTNTGTGGSGSGTLVINGTGSQSIQSTVPGGQSRLPFLKIQKTTGSLNLSGVISESRDWTYISGLVNAGTSTVAFGGNNLAIGSTGMSFNNVSFLSNTSTLSSALTLAGNLVINSGSVLSPVANLITLGGNWTSYGTAGFTESTSTVSFNGNALQSISVTGGENFSGLIINNSGAGIQLANSISIASSLTMTTGNIDLNANSITLGTSALSPGMINYSSGAMINSGTFTRWFAKTVIGAGAVAGLFPTGTIANYRPFNVAVSVAPTTGGTISVSYTDAATNTNTSFSDGPDIIMVRKDLNWQLTTTTLAGGTYNLTLAGTGYGLIGNVSDLRMTLANSVVGSAGINAGSTSNPQVNRTGLTQTNLNNSFYIGSINSSSSPLPVTLIYFNASAQNGIVKLDWETSAEVNNDHFTVQRKKDSTAWVDIAIVPGSGNTNTDSRYTSFDLNPLTGDSYYRLKQTDKDAQTSFSAIRQIHMGNIASVQIYPNPAIQFLYIKASRPILFTIWNINGKKLNLPIENHLNTSLVDVSNLQPGAYLIQIIMDGTKDARIFVKE